MATANHKRAVHAEEAVAFSGMDACAPTGDGAAYYIQNFKILPDGSLRRREGFGHLASLGDSVRAVYVRHEADGDFLLAVAGACIYRVDLADGSFTWAEVLSSDSGRAVFFEHGGLLYLSDGVEVYRYRGGTDVSVCMGYIPLYGKDWDPDYDLHEVYEPVNLLCPKVRVRYLANELTEVIRLSLGMPFASVDKVLIDGSEVTEYTVSDGSTPSIRFPVARDVGVMEVCFTLDFNYWHDALVRSCTSAARYDSLTDERVFFYGGEDADVLYASVFVDSASLAEARVMDQDATAIYVPKGHGARLGNGQPITSVCRVGDRMMVGTANGAWITVPLGDAGKVAADGLVLRSLSQVLGCLSREGVALTDGECPVTLSAGGIYRWSIHPKMERECTVKRISDGVADHMGADFFGAARVFHALAEDELWFYRPGDDGGQIWIYNNSRDLWYGYEGVRASHFFDTGSGIGFADGANVYLFDAARNCDLLPYGERAIVSVLESGRLDFGDREAQKRAARVYVEAEAAEGEITVGLYDDGLLDEVAFRGREGMRVYSARVSTPRFHRLSAVVRAVGNCPIRIYGLCIHTGR